MPGVAISTSTVDHPLDSYSYSMKLVTQRPVDVNRGDIRCSLKAYVQWLQCEGPRLCRFYVDETNYNIWCSRSFSRAAKGQSTMQTTGTKGANLNIVACMSANGVIHWAAVVKVHSLVFNKILGCIFLADISARVESEEPGVEALFLIMLPLTAVQNRQPWPVRCTALSCCLLTTRSLTK